MYLNQFGKESNLSGPACVLVGACIQLKFFNFYQLLTLLCFFAVHVNLRKKTEKKYFDGTDDEELFGECSDGDDEEWLPGQNRERSGSHISDEMSDEASNVGSKPPSVHSNHNPVDERNEHADSDNNDADEPATGKATTRCERSKITQLRNSGKSYIGSTGKVVKKKTLRPLPQCKATWCLILKLSEEERKEIFEEYWALGSYNKRTQYISNMVQKKDTKTTTTTAKKQRTCTLEYSLIHNQERIQVSKQCFLATLDENDRFVRGVVERRSSSAQVPDDRRGKNPPSNKLSDDVRQEVITHIRKFPAYISHYSRRHSEQLYLGSNLNVSIMHKLYLEENGTKISYNSYLEIFKSLRPKLKFKSPKVDTCETCDSLQNGIKHSHSAEEKETLQQQLDLHVSRAEFAYTCKREDKQSAKSSKQVISTIVFDLEQVLPCPYLTSGNVFYLRQLSVYNLTVFVTETKQAFNFMWHEAIGGRGADEIASCLLCYFSSFLPETVKHVIMYSDTCSGQNKNSLMIAALTITVQQHESIETIDQKFLVSGHTHLECDQVHHQIETRKKKTNVPLHHPQNYFDLVREVGPTNKKYKVKEMQATDIFNFEPTILGTEAPLVWRKSDTDGNKFLFSDAEWFRFQKKSPGIILYKKSLQEEEPFLTLNWKRKRNEPLPEIDLFQKRNTPCPISEAKKTDLLSLRNLINPLYHDFYLNLKTAKDLMDEDPDLPPEYNVAFKFQ
ncbi:uncharacterized protein LOC127751676 isoform X1 [Frankliniella occidentalis]|uniref:Uncharacterized protein LOC127751676 isoform X1 n=2 Tax=Frankliniella occidentalis TaxID=133901 RepID=A0A9C6XUN7_FRAOC|nr:uncharacterized protein LOC127751676 isoform X1 [Frankliniella occidentalis]